MLMIDEEAFGILCEALKSGFWSGPYYSESQDNWFMIAKEHLKKNHGFKKYHIMTLYEHITNDDRPIGHLFYVTNKNKNHKVKLINWRVTNQKHILEFCEFMAPSLHGTIIGNKFSEIIKNIKDKKLAVAKVKHHPKSGNESPLARWRIKNIGKTQLDISASIGISASYYAMLESGRKLVTTQKIKDKLIQVTGDNLIVEKMEIWKNHGIAKNVNQNICLGMKVIILNLGLTYNEVRELLLDGQALTLDRVDQIAWGKAIPTDKELIDLLDYMNPDEGDQLTIDQARALFQTDKWSKSEIAAHMSKI